MKKWETPELKDLNYKFTKKNNNGNDGIGNGQPEGYCYCWMTGNSHDHGAKKNGQCPCCDGEPYTDPS